MNSIYELDKQVNTDHVATPRWVVENIYDIININQFNNIWFPFNNYDSEFKLKADELNLKYKATHIFDDLANDFFNTMPPKNCELLISNPPFSQQNEIIKRTFELIDKELIKSFCLLLPLSTLETPSRAEMYRNIKNDIYKIASHYSIDFVIAETEVIKKSNETLENLIKYIEDKISICDGCIDTIKSDLEELKYTMFAYDKLKKTIDENIKARNIYQDLLERIKSNNYE